MKKKFKEDRLPVYELVIDDDEDTGIRLVSLVQDPAIEMKGMFFSSVKEKDFQFKAIKDQQMVVGPALIPNKKIIREDENGDPYYVVFTPENIRKMVKKFRASGTNRKINFNHTNQMVDGYIEHDWIVEDSVYDKSRHYGFELPVSSYFMEVKIDDKDFFDKYVKEDGFFGFSIEGRLGEKLIKMSSDFIEKTIDDYIDSLDENDLMDMIKDLKNNL